MLDNLLIIKHLSSMDGSITYTIMKNHILSIIY
jgi:hypothetical protein